MSSANEPLNFGQQVTIVLLVFILSLWGVTYTFNLFKPYLAVACAVDPAPVDPAES